MSTSKGLPTNAVFVFTNMIQKLLKEMKPDYFVVVWDTPGKTFRDEKFAEYKANRSEMPLDLAPQINYIHKLVDAFNIATLEKEGFEADDVIATIAAKLKHKDDLEIVIVSGDKDMGQILDKNVTMLDSMKEKITTTEHASRKSGG